MCLYANRRPLTKTIEQGAQSEITCCIAPYETLVPGAYYDHRRPAPTHPQASNVEMGKKLWNKALEHGRQFMLNPQLAEDDTQ